MNPGIGEHWIEHRGSQALCALRDWRPATSTFANTVLMVVRFLAEHDCEASLALGSSRLPRRLTDFL
jgi:hypothetical protein